MIKIIGSLSNYYYYDDDDSNNFKNNRFNDQNCTCITLFSTIL